MKNYIAGKFNILFAILGVIAVLGAVFLFDRGIAVGLGLLGVLTLCTFFALGKFSVREKEVYVLFLFVLFIHIGAVLFIYLFNFQPFSYGEGDYFGYHDFAVKAAREIRELRLSYEYDNYYPLIIAFVYAATYPVMVVGQLFNAWLASLAILLLYGISREIGASRHGAFLVGVGSGVYPSFVLYTSLLLKDVVVVLLVLGGLLLTIKLLKQFSWKGFLLFYFSLLSLTHFRFYFSFILLFVFIFSWLVFSRARWKERFLYLLVILPLSGFVPYVAGHGYYGISTIRKFVTIESITLYREVVHDPETRIAGAERNRRLGLTKDRKEEQSAAQKEPVVQEPESPVPPKEVPPQEPVVQEPESPPSSEEERGEAQPAVQEEVDITSAEAGAGSSFESDLNFESPQGFLWGLTKSFAYVILGPFPWQLKEARHYFSLTETIPWLLLVPFVMKGILYSLRKYRLALPLLLLSFGIFAVLALFISNFGVITRIRMSAFLVLLPFIPLAFKKYDSRIT